MEGAEHLEPTSLCGQQTSPPCWGIEPPENREGTAELPMTSYNFGKSSIKARQSKVCVFGGGGVIIQGD